jgi:hypothetical protein
MAIVAGRLCCGRNLGVRRACGLPPICWCIRLTCVGLGFAALYVALIAASMARCLAGLALTLLALRNPS